MDTGVIANRYAKAIFQYAADHGDETRLHEEMKSLSEQFTAVPLLKKILDDPTVSATEKTNALITAAGGKKVSNTCKHVIGMVVKNRRGHYMQNIALMYDKVYRREKNIVVIQLTTTEPASQETKKALIDLVIKDKKEKVNFAAKTDPDIIGGFVLAIEDSRLDASVKNQLNQLRLELIKN
jgi:F-type H+-transporting ATPase subunit delta